MSGWHALTDMTAMTVMIDTNVVLDVLAVRKPHFDSSYAALCKLLSCKAVCLFSASAATDVFYILRKYLQSAHEARLCLRRISLFLSFADVLASDVQNALAGEAGDLEDELVSIVAQRNGVRFILTRDSKGFLASAVPAVTPDDFLRGYNGNDLN